MGELEEALDAIKWGTDYLLNCHVEPTKFVAMFGNSEVTPAGMPTPCDSSLLRAGGPDNVLPEKAVPVLT